MYEPNRDEVEFYVELELRINEVGFENIITGGDRNLVLDFTLDYYNYKHHNNTKAEEQVDNRIIDFRLGFSFFFFSDLLLTFATDADIKAGYRADHSGIH